ncbi:MAG: hypothetical protein ACRCZ6_21385 [Kluyvera sp.]|uniref:hypothetical protein n=1 Tax=Kluyvera sp. TaxID=1538228 RepID=UPI003F3781AE
MKSITQSACLLMIQAENFFLCSMMIVQSQLLSTALDAANYQLCDCTAIWRYACDYIDEKSVIPALLLTPLALQGLWRDDRAILHKIESAAGLLPTVECWNALLRGDKEWALAELNNATTRNNKGSRSRSKQYQPPLLSTMIALTLRASDKPEHITSLRALTRTAALMR